MKLRMLVFAVATGRAGAVLLVNGKLKDWRLSQAAAASPRLAKLWARRLIDELQPDVIITEAPDSGTRKGQGTRAVIAAIADMATELEVHHSSVRRERHYANKYAEAAALADRFPEIAPWLPKQPRIWEAEPKATVYFEALAMAVDVLDEPDGPEHAPANR